MQFEISVPGGLYITNILGNIHVDNDGFFICRNFKMLNDLMVFSRTSYFFNINMSTEKIKSPIPKDNRKEMFQCQLFTLKR